MNETTNVFVQDDFQTYLKTQAMNSGSLVQLTRSAHEYEYYKINPQEETKSMSLGKMIHYFILEPDKFTEKYCLMPKIEDYPRALKTIDDLKKACKEYGIKTTGKKQELIDALKKKDSTIQIWEEILDYHTKGERYLLNNTEYQLLLGLEKSISKHGMIKKILADGMPEVSGYWFDDEYKMNCKMRADWITEKGYIVDLKTTTDGSLRSWKRKLVDYRYDVQSAWYSRGYEKIKGVKPKGFIHFVVETKPPFSIYTYLADNTVIECGETGGNNTLGYKQAIDIYKKCNQDNFWPMPQAELEIESMPDYFI